MALESLDGGSRRGEARPVQPRRTSVREPESGFTTFEPNDRAIVAVETATRPMEIVTFLTRWVTAADERTCPVCAPLHGQVFRDGEGPVPPLHRSCRCRRAHAGVVIESRS